MSTPNRYTLPKLERLNSRILIEKLFTGGSKSLPAFPLLISVPKKRFKRAVKRNRVKRQIREAYRKHKDCLHESLEASGKKVVIAFLWLDTELHPSAEVEEKVQKLIRLTAEKLA